MNSQCIILMTNNVERYIKSTIHTIEGIINIEVCLMMI